MNILIAASECAPYIKTGGLADVIGSLPKSLVKENQKVGVIIPYYKKIKEKGIGEYLGYSFINMGFRRVYVGLFKEVRDNVDFYFIDNDEFFNTDNIYGHGNDGERFAYFCFAILESLRIMNFYPDVLHLNDWQTGLIPYLLKAKYKHVREYSNIKTMFSIHNIQYQGDFPKELSQILDVNYSTVMEFNNRINFMKTAIVDADIVTTVSDNYRNETLTDQYGYGLQNMLRYRGNDYIGVLNGIDVDIFNPESDKDIYFNYNIENVFVNKPKNKKSFLKEVGLPVNNNLLCGFVSRLADQKGIELLEQTIEDVINFSDMNFILMGSGEKHYEDYFKYLSNKYPKRVKVYIGYNESFAQKIYASSDLFMVPSKFEPCGLSQMISMRYGTLPLVRETGGLKDTVVPYNFYDKGGSGFSFSNFNSYEFKEVLFLAYDLYRFNNEDWKILVTQAMSKDFSFKVNAQKYIELYNKIVSRRF